MNEKDFRKILYLIKQDCRDAEISDIRKAEKLYYQEFLISKRGVPTLKIKQLAGELKKIGTNEAIAYLGLMACEIGLRILGIE